MRKIGKIYVVFFGELVLICYLYQMKGLASTEKENIERYIKEGKTYKEIGDIYKVNSETIARIKRKFGYSRYEENYFDIIDSEAKAYLLGFILADGCIYHDKKGSKRLDIGIHCRDVEILELFKKEMAPSNKIGKNKNINTLVICSKSICEALTNNYNIIQRKSHEIYLKIKLEKIPDYLMRHFIRGFFDGDGHFGTSKYKYISKKNGKESNSTRLGRFGFTCSNILFVNFLKETFENMGFKGRIYNRDKYTNNLHFSLNKKNTPLIYDFFYKNATFFLKRKKETIEFSLNNTEVSN